MITSHIFAKYCQQIVGVQLLANSSSYIKNLLATLVMIMGLLSSHAGWANNEIVILNVSDYQKDKQLLLDSESVFNLPDEVIEAIHHEVPLSFKTQIELTEASSILGFEYQRTRSLIEYRTVLYAYGVNRVYSLYNNRNQKTQTFKTLEEALKTLATLKAFPIANLLELHSKQRYTLRMRISLDYWNLPAPLILRALFTPYWQLDSQWLETTLTTPLSWQ
ncbi:MAG TPA: DUF4390 domain-containing protein [Thiomicrospira sp.]|jgi:hypothetical protein|nr:DUF4390 domain-containing protein [Thiomicrospira sp.]